jgi:hypothetical protein
VKRRRDEARGAIARAHDRIARIDGRVGEHETSAQAEPWGAPRAAWGDVAHGVERQRREPAPHARRDERAEIDPWALAPEEARIDEAQHVNDASPRAPGFAGPNEIHHAERGHEVDETEDAAHERDGTREPRKREHRRRGERERESPVPRRDARGQYDQRRRGREGAERSRPHQLGHVFTPGS